MTEEWNMIRQSASLPVTEGAEPHSVQQILSGAWRELLIANADWLGCNTFGGTAASRATLEAWISHVRAHITEIEKNGSIQTVLEVAVAALYLFLQANLTGPEDKNCPESLFNIQNGEPTAAANGSSTQEAILESKQLGTTSISEGDRWATEQLAADGEDVEGQLFLPQYLLFTKTCLLQPFDLSNLGISKAATQPHQYFEGPSNRLAAPCNGDSGLHQQERSKEEILPSESADREGTDGTHTGQNGSLEREPSGFGSSLLRQQPDGVEDLQERFKSKGGLPETWRWWTMRLILVLQRAISGPSASLSAALNALIPLVSADIEASKLLNNRERAELLTLANLEAMAIGLEFRDPQMSAKYLANLRLSSGFTAQLTGAMGKRTIHQQDAKAQLLVSCTRGDREQSEFQSSEPFQELTVVTDGDPEDVSDILQSVKLENESEELKEESLNPIEQGVLLAMGEQYRFTTAKDEMQAWQIVAFANAVLSQQKTRYILQLAATLSRLRFERGRSRTKQRALMSFERIIHQHHCETPAALQRVCLTFSTKMPFRAALEKEYGEQLVSNGLVGEALQVFERRELWDSLLVCYQLLDKVSEALSLAEARLKETPGDARLLCALGDLTQKPSYYEEAWTRSNGRSARSQRSLGRMAMSKANYKEAAEHWSLALSVNSLHPEGWFALGYCYLKLDERQQALHAFTRATQQQSDHGDAWNNIAALCLKDGKFKEAFTALKEAVKHKRESWQTWSNYAEAAFQTGNLQAAFHALKQVGSLSGFEKVDLNLLIRLVDEVLGLNKAPKHEKSDPSAKFSESELRNQKLLRDSARQILKGMSNAATVDPAVWGLLAQLNESEGFADAARDGYKKQIRATAGLGWKEDPEQFQRYARSVEQSATFALGPLGSAMDLRSSKMLVLALLKGAGESVQQCQSFVAFKLRWEDQVWSKEDH